MYYDEQSIRLLVAFRAILVFRTDTPSRIRDIDSPRSN